MDKFYVCFKHLKCAHLYTCFYTGYDFISTMNSLLYENNNVQASLNDGKIILHYENKFQAVADDMENFTAIFNAENIEIGDFILNISVFDDRMAAWLTVEELERLQAGQPLQVDMAEIYNRFVPDDTSSLRTLFSFDGVYKYTAYDLHYKVRFLLGKEQFVIQRTVIEIKYKEVPVTESLFQRAYKEGSKLRSIYIKDFMKIPFHEEMLEETLKRVGEEYDTYRIYSRAHDIRGHCIDIDCLYIETPDFLLVFEREKLLEVHISEQIVYDCYYTTTLGVDYNLGNIRDEEFPADTDRNDIAILGRGANDAWHRISKAEGYYAYSCGYMV